MASQDHGIPIDQRFVDGEYSDDDALSLTSAQTLASSATRYRYENGRRYHAYRDGEYFIPNDEKQSDAETCWHLLCLMSLNDALYLAPIQEPRRVLDVGTGMGLWPMDMGDRYPTADILGVDLSPCQPTNCPPNVRFEVDDAASDWTHPPDYFDLVHIRAMCGGIADWPKLYIDAFRHTMPGGYFEQVEFDINIKPEPGSVPPPSDSPLLQFFPLCNEAARRWGKPMDMAKDMAPMLAAAGFVDVVERVYKWPLAPWSSDPKLKEMGRWNGKNWEIGTEGWVLALLTRHLDWSYQEVQQWVKSFEVSLKDRRWQLYHEVRCVYAKKPDA